MSRLITLYLVLFSTCAGVGAQRVDTLPRYQPREPLSGTIRIWGDDQMQAITRIWEKDFRGYHPRIRFETSLMGTGTGMAGLYTGVADIAFLGRASTPKEIMAFEWIFKYKPLEIDLLTGSLDVPGKSPALVVFTHNTNPISKLTLTQLGAIFGCDRQGASRSIRNWGQLGLKGEWAEKRIHAYGYDSETGSALFFKDAVLHGSGKWNWEQLQEFRDVKRPDGSMYEAGRQILDALAGDPYGIAVSISRYRNPQVKPVALSAENSGPYYVPSAESLIAHRYPLTRVVHAYVNRPPGKPLDPAVREFLRYILSREGQNETLSENEYLPLDEHSIIDQLKTLQ